MKNSLYNRYLQVQPTAKFDNVKKMIRELETGNLNFSKHSLTNAKTENLKSKIQRFVSSNFGDKDKDFFLFTHVVQIPKVPQKQHFINCVSAYKDRTIL
ncbi:MAG: transposase [Tannerella sp.]|nr:transposase [Tannerella sp.]